MHSEIIKDASPQWRGSHCRIDATYYVIVVDMSAPIAYLCPKAPLHQGYTSLLPKARSTPSAVFSAIATIASVGGQSSAVGMIDASPTNNPLTL